MNNINYGKYPVPKTLLQIIDLQSDLAKQGLLRYGDLLGYYFSPDVIRYPALEGTVSIMAFLLTLDWWRT